jgi:hypothetical protein
MENFSEISKKIQFFATKDSYLGVEDFKKREYFDVSYNKSYYNFVKYNNYETLISFLSYFEEKIKILDKFDNKEYLNLKEDFYKKFDILSDKINEIEELLLLKKYFEEKIYNLENYDNTKNEKKLNIKNSEIKDFKKEIYKINKEIKKTIENLNEIKDIYNFLDNLELKNIQTSANLYVKSLNSDIANFIVKKIDDTEFVKWNLTKAQKYEEIVFFKDESIAVKDKNGYKAIDPVGENYNELAKEISKDLVSYWYRKKPSFIPSIISLLEKDDYGLDKLNALTNTFINNEQIFKNLNIDFSKLLEQYNKKGGIEKIDDLLNKSLKEYKVKKYGQSIISNKYKHLYNKKTELLFEEIYDLKVPQNVIQDFIGKKLASFKTSNKLNESLVSFLNSINSFDMESTLNKMKNLNAEVCFVKDNILVLQINDFDASKAMGSTSWCISRNESYFNSYSSGGNQYFYYDFSKDSKNKTSMIGFTIYKNGTINTAHLKNDDYIDFEENYYDIYIKTLIEHKDKYKLRPEIEKLLEEEIKLSSPKSFLKSKI